MNYNLGMNAVFDEVLTSARTLPKSDKAALAHLLIQDLDETDDVQLELLWIDEVKRRHEAVKRGEMAVHDGDEVMARLRSLVK